jgi:hypothetical protein
MLPASTGILTQLQREVLAAAFARVDLAKSFGLSAGTALHEFYAGARRSEDLGLFTPTPDLVRPFGRALASELPKALPGLRVEVLRDFGTFTMLLATRENGTVRMDIGAADPPVMGPIREVEGTHVFDLADIAAGKAHSIADRREPRDAFDLWVIVTKLGYSMEAIEALLFEKDHGLRDYPPAWIAGLRNLADSSDLLPTDLQSMLLVPANEGELRAFLYGAADGAVERARRRLPE